MKEICLPAKLPPTPSASFASGVTLGFFQGVHLGHQAVLKTCVNACKAQGLTPTLFTFGAGAVPPSKGDFSLLDTPEAGRARLEELGIETIFAPPFAAVSTLTCRQTVDWLLQDLLGAKLVVVGEQIRFGHKAAGDLNTLKALCAPKGIQVIGVPQVLDAGQPISATRIRQALQAGDVATANRLLGRPFGFASQVVGGNRLGRTISFPTVNQPLPTGLACPKKGVYKSRVTLPDGRMFDAMTNIGTKPTVGGKVLLAESYLKGFDEDAYGQLLQLQLLGFLRPEEKFASLEALKAQLQKDAQACFEA